MLARTFILEKGKKPVRSPSATTPIGKTECGSYPKTANGRKNVSIADENFEPDFIYEIVRIKI